MSWAPADLLTDTDLLAYAPKILSQFGQVSWQALRAKTLEDWLFPSLVAANYDPQRFRTRYAPDAACIDANGTFTTITGAAQDNATDDITLATAFASTSTRLCVGSASPFRGVSVRMLDTVNATAATLTVQLWRDAWQTVAVADGTQATAGTPFSRGGAITWTVPEDWTVRAVNGTTGYWARLVLSATPAAGKLSQIGVIRRSRLCGAVTHRTLSQIYRAAPLSSDGPWDALAGYHEAEADRLLSRMLPVIGGEFDSVTGDDVVDTDEAAQTADEARNATAWTWERA